MSRRCTTRGALLFCMALLVGGLWPVVAGAQESGSRRVGISAAIREDQTEIMVPIWTGNKSAIVPSFAVSYESNADSWYKMGLAVRIYLGGDKVVPYFGVLGAARTARYEEIDKSATDGVFGPQLGGEYFLSDHFSLGVETRVEVTIEGDRYYPYWDYESGSYHYSTRTGNTLVNTHALVIATMYF